MIDFSYGLSLLFYKIKNKLSGKRNKYDEDAQEAYQTVYPNTFDSEEMNDENVTESGDVTIPDEEDEGAQAKMLRRKHIF